MKHKLIIALMICSTPFLIAKLIDIHVPTKDDIYMEYMREKESENRESFDILKDMDSTEQERRDAYDTLVDNGVMA